MGSGTPPSRSPRSDPALAWAGYRPRAWRQVWAPICSLTPDHRESIQAHLLALGAEDRYLRFGYPVNDVQIERHVQALDFERDELFGIFDTRLELIALSHLAYPLPSQLGSAAAEAEFSVSVLEKARHRGHGAQLFEHAVMHARNRHIETLHIYALSENAAMLKIARKAGAKVERHGGESAAYLKLPPDTLATHVEEFLEGQAAEMDYQLKRQFHHWSRLMEKMTGTSGKSH